MNTISDYMTVKCPICGSPYTVWSTIMTDQSACPNCRNQAMSNIMTQFSLSDTGNAQVLVQIHKPTTFASSVKHDL